jgi:hypothetical protein
MFNGNGGMPKFIISNPKHLEVLGGPSGLGGFEPPLHGSIGCLAKILSTSLAISICTLTNFVSLGV